MKILVEIRHPAHVHHFKYFIREMRKRGHTIEVLAKEKDGSGYLLDKNGISYIKIGRNTKGLLAKFMDMLQTDCKVFKIARQFRPDIFVGRASPSLAYVSFLMRKPYISFSDTEHAKLIWLTTKAFMSSVVTPSCFRKWIGEKHIRYAGCHELAYLHPNNFTPDPFVLNLLGVEKNEKYVIIRFVSWNASHDIGHSGLSLEMKKKAVKELSKYARVFISSEGELSEDLKPYQIKIPPEKVHDALAYATLLYGESATMASECAVLGTPAIFLDNNGRGYTDEEEDKYGLVFNFTESVKDQELSIQKGLELLKDPNIKQAWQARRQKMLADKIDVTMFMVWFIENYPDSVKTMKEDQNVQWNFK